MSTALYLLCLGMALMGSVCGNGWSYWGDNGPEHWSKSFPKCGGSRQSPIDITGASYDPRLTPLHLNRYNRSVAGTWTLKNNGHTVVMELNSPDMTVSGGGLPKTYTTAQFHFHWGKESSTGSEHTINGRQYPLEMHIVSYRSGLGSVDHAKTVPNGLAVLGVMFELSSDGNSRLDELVKNMGEINKEPSSLIVTPFPLRSLMPGDLTRYYRYSGSLTTPTCDESVIWTVFQDTVKISESQLREFRHLQTNADQSMVDTFRPVQPLNGRIVTNNFL